MGLITENLKAQPDYTVNRCACGKRFATPYAMEIKSCGFCDLTVRNNPAVLRTHNSWSQLKHRFKNPGRREYRHYQARGITYPKAWELSFWSFVKDLGLRPEGAVLCRLDLKAGFSKSNCLWAARSEIGEIRALLG